MAVARKAPLLFIAKMEPMDDSGRKTSDGSPDLGKRAVVMIASVGRVNSATHVVTFFPIFLVRVEAKRCSGMDSGHPTLLSPRAFSRILLCGVADWHAVPKLAERARAGLVISHPLATGQTQCRVETAAMVWLCRAVVLRSLRIILLGVYTQEHSRHFCFQNSARLLRTVCVPSRAVPVWQLNIYGFHKTKHDEQSCEFKQPHFRRGQRQLLGLIRRKGQGNTMAAKHHGEENVRTVVLSSPARLKKIY